MGLATAMITLTNPRMPELKPVEVEALADTGSVHLSIREHVRLQLRLEERDRKEACDPVRKTCRGPLQKPRWLRRRPRYGRSGSSWCDPDGGYGLSYSPEDKKDRCKSGHPEYCVLDRQVGMASKSPKTWPGRCGWEKRNKIRPRRDPLSSARNDRADGARLKTKRAR